MKNVDGFYQILQEVDKSELKQLTEEQREKILKAREELKKFKIVVDTKQDN